MSGPVVTAILTLVGGIVLFVLNQLAQKLVLEPLQEEVASRSV